MAQTVRLCRLVSVAALAVVSVAAQVERGPIPERPELTEQEIIEGKRLFDGHCAGCHGPGGSGALGPNLAKPRLSRATDAESLFLIIDLGIEGTEMPRGSQLHDREIWKVTAYVESLGKQDPEPLPGDPAAGRRVYESKGNCAACHWLDGSGGRQGPELTEIGVSRSVAHLRESLVEPAAAVPQGFLLVTAIHKDGRRIQGVRLYDGPFSIQIRDFSDKLHSLMKSELTEVVRREGESSMPAYASTLTNTEMNDLVAYLATLQGDL